MIRFFTTLIIVSIISCSINYIILLSQRENDVKNNLQKIEATLAENFEQVERILIFVGKKIESDNPDLDLNKIHKIFTNTSSTYGLHNVFSWSLFDWVDRDNRQTVNTMYGVNLKDPADVSDRYYALRGSKQWALLFSKPIFGTPSKILVIPVGVQIATAKYPRAGTVVLGMDVKKLVNDVEAKLDKNIHFAVVDERDDKFAFGSQDAQSYFGDISYSRIDILGNNHDVLTKIMDERYPYKIFVRYDKNEFYYEYLYSSLLLLMQLVGAAIVVVTLKKKK